MSPAQPSLVPAQKEPIHMAKKSPLSPEARSIINARVSRRAVLAGIGGVGAAGALAACGSGGDSAASGDAIRWGNWPLYLDFDEASRLIQLLKSSPNQLVSMSNILKITTTTMNSSARYKHS